MTCTICGHAARNLREYQYGMCNKCPERVRHTPNDKGIRLCRGLSLIIGLGTADGPACPACATIAATGRTPIQTEDIRLLRWAMEEHPMYDHWTSPQFRHVLANADRGVRLERDGYLTASGRHPAPTPLGRKLVAEYLSAIDGVGVTEWALAAALRAIGRAEAIPPRA